MEETERVNSGIAGLKLGYNRVHGYYFEISKATLVTQEAPLHFQRRQTLKNAERFTTPELKTFEDKALSAESQALSRERHLFDKLLNPLTDAINDLKTLSQLLAELMFSAVSQWSQVMSVGSSLCCQSQSKYRSAMVVIQSSKKQVLNLSYPMTRN